ncbi:unnamed protein product, partial [marine sediment metagenome]
QKILSQRKQKELFSVDLTLDIINKDKFTRYILVLKFH